MVRDQPQHPQARSKLGLLVFWGGAEFLALHAEGERGRRPSAAGERGHRALLVGWHRRDCVPGRPSFRQRPSVGRLLRDARLHHRLVWDGVRRRRGLLVPLASWRGGAAADNSVAVLGRGGTYRACAAQASFRLRACRLASHLGFTAQRCRTAFAAPTSSGVRRGMLANGSFGGESRSSLGIPGTPTHMSTQFG